MYGLKVYITPKDIIDRLCDEDKARFNQCIFTDITKEGDGSITIDCVLFNDSDLCFKGDMYRQRYCDSNLSVNIPRLESKKD